MSRARNCFTAEAQRTRRSAEKTSLASVGLRALRVSAVNALGFRRQGKGQTSQRAERRAAPKPARIPLGDRPVYPPDEGQT